MEAVTTEPQQQQQQQQTHKQLHSFWKAKYQYLQVYMSTTHRSGKTVWRANNNIININNNSNNNIININNIPVNNIS